MLVKQINCVNSFIQISLFQNATEGLGKALTGALHDCNANVTALSKTSKKLEELRAEFPRIRTLCVDLRDWETTRKMLTKIESPFDGVINNAATAHPESVMNITPETFQT